LTPANDNQEYKEVTPVMEETPPMENWLIWNCSKSKQIEEPNDKQESKEELATPLIPSKEKAELERVSQKLSVSLTILFGGKNSNTFRLMLRSFRWTELKEIGEI
jgi:hypothetical protein